LHWQIKLANFAQTHWQPISCLLAAATAISTLLMHHLQDDSFDSFMGTTLDFPHYFFSDAAKPQFLSL
jgi:hypothetical protein